MDLVGTYFNSATVADLACIIHQRWKVSRKRLEARVRAGVEADWDWAKPERGASDPEG